MINVSWICKTRYDEDCQCIGKGITIQDLRVTFYGSGNITVPVIFQDLQDTCPELYKEIRDRAKEVLENAANKAEESRPVSNYST